MLYSVVVVVAAAVALWGMMWANCVFDFLDESSIKEKHLMLSLLNIFL